MCSYPPKKRNITWEIFATSHSKGAVDGIGGVVKRIVSTAVLSKEERVQNATNFFRVAKSRCKKITVLYCGTKEIECNIKKYNKKKGEIFHPFLMCVVYILLKLSANSCWNLKNNISFK